VAALVQNGDGLRADQAGAADDDDFHGLPSLFDGWRPLSQIIQVAASNREPVLPITLELARDPTATNLLTSYLTLLAPFLLEEHVRHIRSRLVSAASLRCLPPCRRK
jgi:hypothetical protein